MAASPTPTAPTLSDQDVLALVDATHRDPFGVLGLHGSADTGFICRCLLPGATSVEVLAYRGHKVLATLAPRHAAGVFEGPVPGLEEAGAYRLKVTWPDGTVQEREDPYRFGPVLGELDLHLLGEGTHTEAYTRLGAHPMVHGYVSGTNFAVWAPNATRVAVVGDFNSWDGRMHGMRQHPGAGIWEIFIPGVDEGARYKFEIKGPKGELLPLKADPFAFYADTPPGNASVVHGRPTHRWTDGPWMKSRETGNDRHAPISIYEVHLGSWARGPADEQHPEGRYLSYDELADRLVAHVTDMGFTHIELMPVSEFPFDGSWGYQPIGLFAPTARFGPPEGFQAFVDHCHGAGIGVICDWVPGHFPTDAHGLATFDGTHLYEHADPRQGFHLDWNTLIYNYGRVEVRNFLLANARYWFDTFHIDGLRVDAVASMLYLDYSRPADAWVPNKYGGRENLEAIDLLKEMNAHTFGDFPGATTFAEESTAWPAVSRPLYTGGLGFGFKWNMGWMHDTLRFMSKDPVHRRFHHNDMTFGLLYAFSENFVLPLSHDEVVHGKGSLIGKMPGDRWQKFANLRAYYAFMWSHPGKKLLFMGGEFGQIREWSEARSLDWHLLDAADHAGLRDLVRDLNGLYRSTPALHRYDCEPQGFSWIDANDIDHSSYSFLRHGDPGEPTAAVLLNFVPVPRRGCRFGLPSAGPWRVVLNTDDARYGGSGVGPGGAVFDAEEIACHGRPYSIDLTLPPLAALYLIEEA